MIAIPRKVPKQTRTAFGVIRRHWPRHVAFIKQHECANPACKKHPVDPAHVRKGTDGGAGIKPSDWWTIPLCRPCHDRQHRVGEPAFERETGIDMKALALAMAKRSPDKRMQMAMKEAGL